MKSKRLWQSWSECAVTDKLTLVDSSAWILALRRDYDITARKKLEDLLIRNRVAIIGIICLELLGGVRTKKEFERLQKRLEALYTIPLLRLEWNNAAELAFKLRRKGKTIPYTDILIGSVALHHNLNLLHADRHFDLIAEETGLKTESLLHIDNNLS